jgi:hypothetical protein
LVNRRRGFESCIRLHTTGSDVFASVAQTDRVASFYLARCGFKSRRRLVVMPPLWLEKIDLVR